MTATETLPWLAGQAALAWWRELPRGLVAGGAVVASAVPLVVAAVGAAPAWILAPATVPPALALTGLARFAAATVRGDRPAYALLLRFDPVLAAVLAAAAALATAGPALGALIGAGLVLVGPSALAYGAVRERRGWAALRGGIILAVYRPVWALTLAALGCLGGFAIAASAGVLAPAVPPLLLTIGARQTAALLDEIDARPR